MTSETKERERARLLLEFLCHFARTTLAVTRQDAGNVPLYDINTPQIPSPFDLPPPTELLCQTSTEMGYNYKHTQTRTN